MSTVGYPGIMRPVVSSAIGENLEKTPALAFSRMEEQGPDLALRGEENTVEVSAPDEVEAAGVSSTSAHGLAPPGPVTKFFIAACQNQTERPAPWVVVKAPVGVAGDESVNVDAAPERQLEQKIPFQVGFAIVAVDNTAGQATTEPV